MKQSIKHQGRKPLFSRRLSALAAFLLVGIFSPFGMKALSRFNVQAPLSDIVLSTTMLLIILVIYRFLRRAMGLCTVVDSRKRV